MQKIQRIFLSEGLLLAAVGGVSGMLIALVICELQQNFHLVKLEGNTFIIDYYPVQMHLPDFLLVAITVFTVAIIAAWVPSRKAAVQLYSLKVRRFLCSRQLCIRHRLLRRTLVRHNFYQNWFAQPFSDCCGAGSGIIGRSSNLSIITLYAKQAT